MITRYKKFLEARVEDNFKTDNEDFKKYQNREFNDDIKLINYIVLDKTNKILHIKWYHTKQHSIVERIKNRTNFKSISEFNECFENIVNDLFKNHFYEIKEEFVNYNIYLQNRKISIIVNIDYNNLFENNTILDVRTIINGLNSDVDEIIEIKDN